MSLSMRDCRLAHVGMSLVLATWVNEQRQWLLPPSRVHEGDWLARVARRQQRTPTSTGSGPRPMGCICPAVQPLARQHTPPTPEQLLQGRPLLQPATRLATQPATFGLPSRRKPCQQQCPSNQRCRLLPPPQTLGLRKVEVCLRWRPCRGVGSRSKRPQR